MSLNEELSDIHAYFPRKSAETCKTPKMKLKFEVDTILTIFQQPLPNVTTQLSKSLNKTAIKHYKNISTGNLFLLASVLN